MEDTPSSTLPFLSSFLSSFLSPYIQTEVRIEQIETTRGDGCGRTTRRSIFPLLLGEEIFARKTGTRGEEEKKHKVDI